MVVLVLGHNGMLGHMVLKYLKSVGIDTVITEHKWPTTDFKSVINDFSGDYIINCIGSIPQRKDNFDINWELPIYLDFYGKSKVIHPGTDCEMDDDPYGLSKRISRDFIVNTSKKTKSLKTSIIGPELNSNSSLLEWFLSNNDGDEVFGYSEFYWDGNTTLTWAEICFKMMNNWDYYDKETIISSDCISKKEILESINDVYSRKIIIKPKSDITKNKCLCGKIKTQHIKQQLIDLSNFKK